MLTPFQEECRRAVCDTLRMHGVACGFDLVHGEEEDYLRGPFSLTGKSFEVYIYMDEAGFFDADKWFICESPDYTSEEELITNLIQALEKQLAKTA